MRETEKGRDQNRKKGRDKKGKGTSRGVMRVTRVTNGDGVTKKRR